MLPWRVLLVFLGVSAGATTAIAVLTASRGWTVHSPAWVVLGTLAMWAPALARFVTRRTVDRGSAFTLPLSRWGETGARVVLVPVVVPIVVYGVAYYVGWLAGLRAGAREAASGRWDRRLCSTSSSISRS